MQVIAPRGRLSVGQQLWNCRVCHGRHERGHHLANTNNLFVWPQPNVLDRGCTPTSSHRDVHDFALSALSHIDGSVRAQDHPNTMTAVPLTPDRKS